MNQLGLSNAVTDHSKSIKAYDKAHRWEVLGGDIVALAASEWTVIQDEARAMMKREAKNGKA